MAARTVRTNPDGSKDVLDENGNVITHLEPGQSALDPNAAIADPTRPAGPIAIGTGDLTQNAGYLAQNAKLFADAAAQPPSEDVLTQVKNLAAGGGGLTNPDGTLRVNLNPAGNGPGSAPGTLGRNTVGGGADTHGNAVVNVGGIPTVSSTQQGIIPGTGTYGDYSTAQPGTTIGLPDGSYQTTNPDGTKTITRPNGDGNYTVTNPDGTTKVSYGLPSNIAVGLGGGGGGVGGTDAAITAADKGVIASQTAASVAGLANAAQATRAAGADANAAATARANEAIGRGDAALATAQAGGQQARTTAAGVAAPLTSFAATEQAQAGDARAMAANYAAQTGTSLAEAEQMVSRLQELANSGDPTATARLASFAGSAGTANQLGAFNPTTATNLNAFDPSQGTAAALAATNPNYSATGALDSFEGERGTAEELRTLPTGVSATNALGGYQPNNGTAPALEGLPTETSATGNLLGFQGSRGTADEIRGMRTGAAATGDLANFQGTGGVSVDQLERLGRGEDIGPSAAEALLKKQADQTMASNIALARSGRGAGNAASALRQATFVNAKEQQDLGTSLAALRAQEAATARGQNIGAATAAAGARTTISAQDLAALQARQQGELQAEKDKLDGLVASGQLTQQQAGQQLDALKTAQAAQTAAIQQKSTNIATAGAQYQTQSQQRIQALTAQQQGQLQAERDRLDALVASGQMTQTAANQRLQALQAEQQGQIAAEGQRIQAVTAAGTQMQTASAQQLDAMKAQQSTEMQGEKLRLDALVASGQMTQKQADQQLDALKSTQQGQIQAETNRINAATAGGQIANTSAATKADLAKTFATIGLNYDVNSGNVLNNAGQIVMTGEQVNAQMMNSGLAAQTGQGQVGATLSGQGLDALMKSLGINADLTNAGASMGMQGAGALTALDQAALTRSLSSEQQQNALLLQKYGIDKNVAVQMAAQDQQATAALLSGLATLGAGAFALSDIRSKKDIAAAGFGEFLANTSGRGRRGRQDPADLFDARPSKGFTYRYRDEGAPGAAPGRHFGPMAQDMLKSGRAISDAVGHGKDGHLFVDPQRAGLAAVAGLGEEQRRVDQLEDVVARLVELAGPVRSDRRDKRSARREAY